MTNTETGVINEEVLDEKVLSAIIEFKIETAGFKRPESNQIARIQSKHGFFSGFNQPS